MKHLALFTAIFMATFFGLVITTTHAFNDPPNLRANVVFSFEEVSGYNPNLTIPQQGNKIIHYVVHANNLGPGSVTVKKEGSTNPISGWQATGEGNAEELVTVGGKTVYQEGESGVTDFYYDTAQRSCGRVQIDIGFKDTENTADRLAGDQMVTGIVINYGVDCSTLPQGYLDGASCTHIGGWSIDFDTPNSFVNIEIYRNGPFGTGTLSTTTSAYHFRSDINSIYNLGNHAFGITTPSDFLDGNSHSVYAYGIDTQTGARVLLSPSSTTTPLVISCPNTPVSPTVDLKANGSDGPITIPSGTSATLSWISQNATSCALFINNINTGWTGTSQSDVQTGNITIATSTYRVDCTGSGGNASDTVVIYTQTSPAASANLSVLKTADKATANVLDTLTYTIIVANAGPDNATGAFVTDILSNKLNFVSASSSVGSFSTTTGQWTIGNLNNNSSATLTIVSTIKAGNEGQVITNTATTTANQNDSNTGDNTSTVTTTVNGIPVNGKITFCLILSDINNVIATTSSDLPAGIFSLDLNTSTTSGSTVQTKTWNTPTFSPNKKIILGVNDADCVTFSNLPLGTYYYSQMTVNGALWLVPRYNDQNTSSVNNIFDFFIYSPELFNASSTDDAGRNLNSDGQIILAAGDMDKTLVVLEKDDPGTSCPAPQITSLLSASGVVGSPFTYTFTASSTTAVTYSASGLPPGLTFSTTTHIITGTPTTVGTYNVSLGAVNTCIGGIDIKTLVITITTPGGGGSPNANLIVSKTVDKASANVLDTLTYTITLKNNGPDAATGVIITDILSGKLEFVSATSTLGSYATSTGIWSVGNLANGASATTTIVAKIKAGNEGQTIANSAVGSATQADSNPNDNTSSVSTSVNTPGCTSNCGGGGCASNCGGGGYSPNSNLAISKTSDKSTAKVGDNITFLITVINNGPDNATAVNVNEAIPAGLNFVSATTTKGTYVPATGLWVIGDLNTSSSTTLIIRGTVKDGYQGQTISNMVTVYASQNDPVPSNNTARVDVPVTGTTTATTPTVPNGCYYLLDYLRADFNNNPVEVRKLQVFLRDLEGFSTVQITGVYDDQTIVALDAFQSRYASDILTPWGHTAPTSYTYILTKKKVNEIYCKIAFPVNAQQQIEIDTYRNFLLGLRNAGIIPPTTSENNVSNTSNNTNETTTPSVLLNNQVGIGTTTPVTLVSATTTPGIVSRFTANVVFAWDKITGGLDWCGWLNILLLIIIGIISYLWYREWDRNRKIEAINKEIDLNK